MKNTLSKICHSCGCSESDEPIFKGNKCRTCYNSERLAYYYDYGKKGKSKTLEEGQALEGYKVCKKCHNKKAVSEFYINKIIDGKTYYRGSCKDCVRKTVLRQPVPKSTFNQDAARFKNAVIYAKDGTIRRYDSQGIQLAC